MRAVVTGGAGFLGSHLCDKLLAEGWKVLALDNLITGAKGNLSHLKHNKKFHFQRADICKPLKVAGKNGPAAHLSFPARPPPHLINSNPPPLVRTTGHPHTAALARGTQTEIFV